MGVLTRYDGRHGDAAEAGCQQLSWRGRRAVEMAEAGRRLGAPPRARAVVEACGDLQHAPWQRHVRRKMLPTCRDDVPRHEGEG